MLFEAGIVSLIRTILIFIGVYYGFRLIFRFIVPYLLKRYINKRTGNYSQQNTRESSSKEGEVRFEKKTKSNSKTENLGDYVDYEEIKENNNS